MPSGKYERKDPFDTDDKATPKRERDHLGRWLPGAKPEGQAPTFERKEPHPEDLQQIERLAAAGHGIYAISKHLGIDPKTFQRWRKDHPEAKEALARGMEQEEHLIVSELLKILQEKQNPIPGIFLLKSRHGYQEGQGNQTDNRVQIAVTLPAALQPDQYRQLVDVKRIEGGNDDNS